jgi:hypothetical protein
MFGCQEGPRFLYAEVLVVYSFNEVMGCKIVLQGAHELQQMLSQVLQLRLNLLHKAGALASQYQPVQDVLIHLCLCHLRAAPADRRTSLCRIDDIIIAETAVPEAKVYCD